MWSIGILLYLTLTGRAPFDAPTEPQVRLCAKVGGDVESVAKCGEVVGRCRVLPPGKRQGGEGSQGTCGVAWMHALLAMHLHMCGMPLDFSTYVSNTTPVAIFHAPAQVWYAIKYEPLRFLGPACQRLSVNAKDILSRYLSMGGGKVWGGEEAGCAREGIEVAG